MSDDQPKKSRAQVAVDITIELLLADIKALGLPMSSDQRVSEESAAKLLGISHRHLKDLRRGKDTNAPVHYVLGVAGSRLSYRVMHLASWIEAGRANQHGPG